MATASTFLLTADEFYDFVHRPENDGRSFELECGEVVEMPSPGHRHGIVCGTITGLLFLYARQRRNGQVAGNDLGLILDTDPDTVRGPDIAFYVESMPYDQLEIRYTAEMPTLVVEVLSPSNRISQTTRRLNRFLEKGVAVVWMVDPEERSVQVWWQGQTPLVLKDGEEIANIPALPDFCCKVSEIFDPPGR